MKKKPTKRINSAKQVALSDIKKVFRGTGKRMILVPACDFMQIY